MFGPNGVGDARDGCMRGDLSSLNIDGDCVRRAFSAGRPLPNTGMCDAAVLKRNFAEARVYLEQTLHGWPHVSIGGHMGSHQSPADPMFWIHHAQVDRLWAMQQDCQGHSSARSHNSEHWGTLSGSESLPQVGSNVQSQIVLASTGVKYTLGQISSTIRQNCPTSWPSMVSSSSFGLIEEAPAPSPNFMELRKWSKRSSFRLVRGLRALCSKIFETACAKSPRGPLPKQWCVMNRIPQTSGSCKSGLPAGGKKQVKKMVKKYIEQESEEEFVEEESHRVYRLVSDKGYCLKAASDAVTTAPCKESESRSFAIVQGKPINGAHTVKLAHTVGCVHADGSLGDCSSRKSDFVVHQHANRFQFITKAMGCLTARGSSISEVPCDNSTPGQWFFADNA